VVTRWIGNIDIWDKYLSRFSHSKKEFKMIDFLLNLFRSKYKLGIIIVIVLNVISLSVNTILKDNLSEDVRISITAFSAAALCALGLRYLIYRMNQK
jgi:hypothetical protein